MAHKRKILTAIQNGVTSVDLVAAVPGTIIEVVSYIVTAGAGAGTLKFTSGTVPNDISAAHNYAINGGLAVGHGDEGRVLETGVGEKLSCVGTGGPFSITVRYKLGAPS